jgi:tripartite-type tricarboxylate transporter receptor subunit TctC
MKLPFPLRWLTLATLAMAAAAPLAHAQTAGKPVTIVVPFPPGAGPDLAARVIGEKLAARIGSPVIVDNKPGAGTLIGAGAVAKAAPDGQTWLLVTNTLVISPHILPKGAGGGIDVQKDLQPVLALATTPMLVVANPALGASNVEQLLTLAKKSPELTFGSAGNGSPMHFAGEMFAAAAGVKLNHVPYRGVAPLVTAGLGGEVKLLFVGLGGVAQHLKSGKLVALAVAEKARTPQLPEVPTLAERGVKGVELNAWYGLFAPAGTPAPVVQRMAAEVAEVLKMADVRARLEGAGLEIAVEPAAALATMVKGDGERYGRIARQYQITAD